MLGQDVGLNAFGSKRTWVVGLHLGGHLGPEFSRLTAQLIDVRGGKNYILKPNKVWPPGGTGSHCFIVRAKESQG